MSYVLEPRVLEVLKDHRAIVSTRGLRRVVLEATGEPLAEFIAPALAAEWAAHFNETNEGARAVVRRYAPATAKPYKSRRPAPRFRSAV